MLADEVRDLLAHDDPRTIEEMVAEADYATYTVKTARWVPSIGGWEVDTGLWGMTLMVAPEPRQIDEEPEDRVRPGDTVWVFGGAGFSIDGWALNGKVRWFLTPLERMARRLRVLAEMDRARRERFARDREKLDADFEALPPGLRERITRFREADPAFRVQAEAYELFCCSEAAKFVQAARDAVSTGADADEVERFWAMPVGDGAGMRPATERFAERPADPERAWLLWAYALNGRTYDYDYEQQKRVLGLSDEHSGNTFGGAMALALALVEGMPL